MTHPKYELYTDGGVIGHNPSEIGGTWAARLLFNGLTISEKSGVVTPQKMNIPAVTNNLTEMLALLGGLRMLPSEVMDVTIYSDSQITLGRAFMGWKWNNMPRQVHYYYQQARERLTNFQNFKYVLLSGHPTKKELEAGVSKEGRPVSRHNVWCDEECQRLARWYQESIENMKVNQ